MEDSPRNCDRSSYKTRPSLEVANTSDSVQFYRTQDDMLMVKDEGITYEENDGNSWQNEMVKMKSTTRVKKFFCFT